MQKISNLLEIVEKLKNRILTELSAEQSTNITTKLMFYKQ